MFEGSFVAIVTPMKDGKVDGDSLRDLIEFHIANGTNGIVPCGTTGESATLTHDEHCEVISITAEVCKGKLPVLAGTGSNSTREAVELTQRAEKAGQKPGDRYYQTWIDIHTSPGMSGFVSWLRSVVDESAPTPEQRDKLQGIFRDVLRYEYQFFDMAYLGETWP